MTEKEFENVIIEWHDANYPDYNNWMPVKKCEEFIQRLKEADIIGRKILLEEIDKFVGEELTKS